MQSKREKAIAIALKNKYYNVGDNYAKLNDNLHETDPRLSKHEKMMGSKKLILRKCLTNLQAHSFSI